ncbi:uncharacterized protein KD926_008415 [Aspergillus affinis]|uniref:uncharacterized protein n=1 Tax=Aspergillus affinis TaxID=1070780 RepID=UPI0022FDD612|nr:uncharacterized protein KD926_008415 [Aspergillus affinis]KAI9040325.1 hypothetical protein KD926_008415 [Aspergillus affinis]
MIRRPSTGPPATGTTALSRTRHPLDSTLRRQRISNLPTSRSPPSLVRNHSSHASRLGQNTLPTSNISGPSRLPRRVDRVSDRDTSRPLRATIEQTSQELEVGDSSPLVGGQLATARSSCRFRNELSTESVSGNRLDETPSGLDSARRRGVDAHGEIGNVTRDLERALSRLPQVHQEIDIERQSRGEAEGQVAEKEEQNKGLREEIAELKRKLQASESDRTILSEKLGHKAELEAKVQKLQTSNANLQNELRISQEKNQDMTDQAIQNTDTIGELEKKLAKSEDDKQAMSKQLAQNTETIDKLGEKLTTFKGNNRELRRQLDETNRRASLLTAHREEAEKSLNKISVECYNANEERNSLNHKLQECEKRVQELESLTATCEREFEEKYNKLDQTRKESDLIAESHQARFEKEILILESKNETLNKEKHSLNTRNVFLQRKVRQISSRLRASRRHLADESANSKKFRNQEKALSTLLIEVKEEQTRLSFANRDLEALISTLRKDITTLEDGASAVQLALEDTKKESSNPQDNPRVITTPNGPLARKNELKRAIGFIREVVRGHGHFSLANLTPSDNISRSSITHSTLTSPSETNQSQTQIHRSTLTNSHLENSDLHRCAVHNATIASSVLDRCTVSDSVGDESRMERSQVVSSRVVKSLVNRATVDFPGEMLEERTVEAWMRMEADSESVDSGEDANGKPRENIHEAPPPYSELP